jgi:large conductance mechanosensitive channel
MSQDWFDRDRLVGYGKKGLHAGFSTLSGFQKFLIRGNVIDMAVGIVIGAAFNNVVQAFVSDIIQPLIGYWSGNNSKGVHSFDDYIGPAGIHYGALFGVFLSFLITAAIVYFFVVKPITSLRDQYDRLHHKDAAPTTRDCPFCLSSVPLKATRCAYCTAQLPPVDNQAQSASTRSAGPSMG